MIARGRFLLERSSSRVAEQEAVQNRPVQAVDALVAPTDEVAGCRVDAGRIEALRGSRASVRRRRADVDPRRVVGASSESRA
jgi:hypothetical protein